MAKRYLDQKLKFRQLRAIAAIDARKSLLQASSVLAVSQPALTKALKEIEDLFGCRLFERHARGLSTNRRGLLVAETARRILADVKKLEDALDRMDEDPAGTVVIGALPTAASGIMPGVIRLVQADGIDIEVRVVEGKFDELLTSLELGDIDMIVGRLYPMPQDGRLASIPLYDEPMSILCGPNHPLLAKATITPQDLLDYDISLPSASFRIHQETQLYLDTFGITAGKGVQTSSLSLLRELLYFSDLLTVTPRLMLMGDLLRGTLRVLRFDHDTPPPPRPAGLIYRSDRPLLPPARKVADLIALYTRDILRQTDSPHQSPSA